MIHLGSSWGWPKKRGQKWVFLGGSKMAILGKIGKIGKKAVIFTFGILDFSVFYRFFLWFFGHFCQFLDPPGFWRHTPRWPKTHFLTTFWPLFGSTFGPVFIRFCPFLTTKCSKSGSKKWSKSGQKVVKKWSKNGFLAISGCRHFWGYPKKWQFWGVTFWTNFWTPFCHFVRNTHRGLFGCYKRYPKWSKRWSKRGHLRVPKTPILTKNGDFWTKTPRGSPGWWPIFGPLFLGHPGDRSWVIRLTVI